MSRNPFPADDEQRLRLPICESSPIENLNSTFADVPIVRERRDDVKLGGVASSSFGFGGTNASVVFKCLDVWGPHDRESKKYTCAIVDVFRVIAAPACS